MPNIEEIKAVLGKIFEAVSEWFVKATAGDLGLTELVKGLFDTILNNL